jgi:Zn ribbon nucleic-acid-binding protein
MAMNQVRYIPGYHCPACYGTENEKPLKLEREHNARSRFCEGSVFICSACGVEEALRGFFWRDRAIKRGFDLKQV